MYDAVSSLPYLYYALTFYTNVMSITIKNAVLILYEFIIVFYHGGGLHDGLISQQDLVCYFQKILQQLKMPHPHTRVLEDGLLLILRQARSTFPRYLIIAMSVWINTCYSYSFWWAWTLILQECSWEFERCKIGFRACKTPALPLAYLCLAPLLFLSAWPK
jgi:hypothetical protein